MDMPEEFPYMIFESEDFKYELVLLNKSIPRNEWFDTTVMAMDDISNHEGREVILAIREKTL